MAPADAGDHTDDVTVYKLPLLLISQLPMQLRSVVSA
jgi:hypothetical protein